MYVCVKAAVAVLPYVGFTVSHFNDTHSSTQAAIVHPSVQPGNMDKKIQMRAQLMHLKNVNKFGGLQYQQTQYRAKFYFGITESSICERKL